MKMSGKSIEKKNISKIHPGKQNSSQDKPVCLPWSGHTARRGAASTGKPGCAFQGHTAGRPFQDHRAGYAMSHL